MILRTLSALCLLLLLVACDSGSKAVASAAKDGAKAVVAQAEKTVSEVATATPATKTAANAATADAGAADNTYTIDTRGAHAFINAKFKHLGYSVLWATFKEFEGSFTYDADNIENSTVTVTINPASIDSNHTKRDEHMRGADYLDTATYPDAGFTSTSIVAAANGGMTISGDLTLHGVTKNISFPANIIAEGAGPRGGYRVGLEGKYALNAKDFGMNKFKPEVIDIELYLEGIKDS